GVYTAKYLEKALGRRDDFEITLVNRENYFVFQPMLPEVISGSIGLLDTVSPIRRMLPRTNLHVRDIEAIDLTNKTVTTSPGFRPHPHVIAYDYLVFALGNVTDFRGMAGLPEHALPFKNLADALYLRNHVIRALEEAAIEDHDMDLRRQLLTFVVAGGGFSGVEVVAELNDFVREVAKSYRGLDPSELRVVLVHSQDRILPELPADLAQFAQKILQKRGVEVLLNVRLSAATSEEAILKDGTRIPTRTLVSTVPSSPHPIIEGLDLPKGKNGRLICNGQLEVENAPGVFAVGDCGQIPTPGGAVSPPTAQYATRQAKVAAENIVADIRGGAKKTFAFNELGQMGALGHRSAVAQILGFKFSGFVAWWIWRTIYLMKLPGWGRRLKVASSWTLDLLLPAELVELKLNTTMGITQEHFEPGEEVFHQGDLGDRIYMIVSGQAEVVREEGDTEAVLARLGPGEYFGEMALLKQTTRGATVRCTAPMNTISLPKREFGLLAAYLPQVRETLENVMEQRQRDNTKKSMKA
ncbi:MAG TPA: FAD-dependent oxidoreductase, partial [Blastocatellia bacterium]|nr:FAD-dependent oxidoreductase [Blastocatellia bacterium]